MFRSLSREFKLVANSSMVKRTRFYSAGGDGATARKLEGKIALLTGGAKGLGKATAREFIQHGAQVMIADVDSQLGPQVAKELGPAAQFIHCDVEMEVQRAEAVETTLSSHGKLDIMFNNAGILGPYDPPSISELDMDGFDRLMQINVRGVVIGIKHAARVMIPKGSGSILCTCSIGGVLGGITPHAYSISKFAVSGMVKSVASELCKHGVRINCISPTAIPTPLGLSFAELVASGTEEQLSEFLYNLGPLKGSKCEDTDIAKAALYLASDDAKYVTGHNLVVDGGFTCFKSLFPSP